jgi:hypothetical protein
MGAGHTAAGDESANRKRALQTAIDRRIGAVRAKSP